MVGQRRGTGVTGDKKKNHLHNYNVFWSGYLQQIQYGHHLVVRLAKKKKMGNE